MTSHSDTFVSVVMPVYNAGVFLHKSIESILGQSYTDFEFIIINDGSTDGSWEVIESYAKKDDRIVAVNQKNSGVVKTANLAASMARGN
jgi:glycosyltransferase involved in cell wall biosynthesis